VLQYLPFCNYYAAQMALVAESLATWLIDVRNACMPEDRAQDSIIGMIDYRLSRE